MKQKLIMTVDISAMLTPKTSYVKCSYW